MVARIRLTGREVLDVYVRTGSTYDNFSLTVGKERVPPGESAQTFAGYPTLFHALAEASQISRIGLIVQFYGQPRSRPKIAGAFGIGLLGRFHVFASDQPRHKVQPGYDAVLATPRDLNILGLRETGMVQPARSGTWRERLADAQKPEDYLRLLRDFMSLEAGELNVERNASRYATGAVNYNPSLSRANGEGGVVDLPCEKDESPFPKPTMAIGPKAFNPSSPIYTMMTIVHEATHVDQAARTVALVRQWRETRSPDFSNWLQSLWDHREISLEDFQVAEEFCKGGSNTKQILAVLEAFTIGYHHLSRADLRQAAIWQQLANFAQYWGPVHVRVKEYVLERLVKYDGGLDRDHRDALRARLAKGAESRDPFSKALLDKLP